MSTQNDAIQQDVSQADDQLQQQTEQERPLSRRDRDMAAIEASRNAAFEAEAGVTLVATASAAGSEAEAASASQTTNQTTDLDTQLAAQAGESGQKLLDATDGLMVKVKVNGEEREVELSKVLANFQKGESADQRLAEATRLLKEAQQRTAGASTTNAADSTTTENTDAGAATPNADPLGKAKQALSLMYEGDEDAAAQALVDLMANMGGGKPTQNAPDVGQIAEAVTQRIEIESAFARIKSDYPDLLTDPDLDALTTSKASAKEAAGMPRAKAMLEAAQDVYKLIGRQPAGRPNPETRQTTRDAKLANKAEIDNLNPANASATTSTQDDQANDPSAVIAAIAASRLGQSLARPRS